MKKPKQTKQVQHHPAHRAPHGLPEQTFRVSFRCTKALFDKFNAKGGSEWARDALTNAR
jgi:hypothetical protein